MMSDARSMAGEKFEEWKRGKITTEELKEYLDAVVERSERLKRWVFISRITEAISALALLVIAFTINVKDLGLLWLNPFIGFGNLGVNPITIVLAVLALVLVVHALLRID